MSERNNKLELLGSAPIPKALMALGIPIMIGMLINALYNLVDAYFVGGLGESQMGAISVVFPLGQVVVGLGLMFGNGAASYLSRLLGRGNKDTANRVASTALYSSILIGTIIILFSTIFLKPILAMLGATETIMPYALTYSRIYILSCVFNVFNVTMNNIVSGEGAAKTTMCALLLGAALNIGLDPLFIYTFNMGVAGAAIATAISQMVSTLVYLTYVLRKRSAFSFSVKAFSPTGQMMAEILKIGIPTLVFQLLTSLSITLINRAASDYGDSVIAGMGAVTRITSMGTLVVFGFLKGFQPIAGFSYGAKKFNRLREVIKTSIIWSTSFCLVVGLVMAVFHTDYLSIYRGRYSNDFSWSKIAVCERDHIHSFWFLHGLFFSVPSIGKRCGRLLFRSVQTRYLLCPCHFVAAYGMGHERNFVCPTHRRCNFCSHHYFYGVAPSSGTVQG